MCLPPWGSLDTLEGIAVRVAEEDCRPSRLAGSVFDACGLELLLDGSYRLHANAEVTVPAAMRRPSLKRVRVGELHEMDHLRSDPQPGSGVRELIMRTFRVDCQPEGLAVELHGALKITDDQSNVVDALETQGTLLVGGPDGAGVQDCVRDGTWEGLLAGGAVEPVPRAPLQVPRAAHIAALRRDRPQSRQRQRGARRDNNLARGGSTVPADEGGR